MSDDNIQSENCLISSDLHVISETDISESLSQDEEQQTIIDRPSKEDSSKGEKLVLTGPPLKSRTIKKVGLLNEKNIIKLREPSTSRPIIEKNFDNFDKSKRTPSEGNSTKILSLNKPLSVLVSLESRDNKPMEARKYVKHNPTPKPSDLARRKLEVELKAVEEIAKLKEKVIEKRLALELASIDDGFESRTVKKAPSTPLPPPPPDRRPIEDPPKKMYFKEDSPAIQNTLKPERELFYDYSFNRTIPPRPVSGFSRQPPPVIEKVLKNDSSSSVLATLRNLSLGDKKLNIDKKIYSYDDVKTSSQVNLPTPKDVNCVSSACKMAKKHTEFHQNQATNSTTQPNKARMVWKLAMSKIKSKMKNKNPPK